MGTALVARLAAQYDTQAFTDYRQLFGQVDVVSISVPTPQHYQVARDFIEAGLAGTRLIERSPGGGGTRFALAPGASVVVDS